MQPLQIKNLLSFILIILFYCSQLSGQTPGLILKPVNAPGATILDPDGDGYVSHKTNGTQIGFVSNDILESEIPYTAIVKPDPQGDPLAGPSCLYNEIVGTDAAGNNAVLSYFDGTNLLFRFRLGGISANSKGYSLLIDTDQKFGFTGPNADPNAVAGNPGFEIEIVLETNFGVEVYKVDGTTTPVLTTSFATNPYSTNCQKSVALTTACSDPDYFYDFYIPFSQLTSIAGLGITANTPFRVVAVTSMNPHPAIGNSAISDVGGVTTGNNLDAIYSTIIESATPTSTNNINTNGYLDRSACPGINAVGISNTTISGTTTETSGVVTVNVYQSNGTTLLGSATTSTITSGTWSVNVSSLSPSVTLASGQIIKATVTSTGKGISYDNCNPVTVSDCSVQTSIPTATEITKISGSKGYTLTINRPIGTKVYLYTSTYAIRTVTDLKNSVTNPFTTTTNPQTFTFECQTGNCFGTDVYYFRYQEPGKCISPYYVSCDYATGGLSSTPTISTSTITTSTTTINGNGTAASSQILIYADGNQIASTTSAATSPFAWSASVSSLRLCQVITARQIVSGSCLSNASTGITVTRPAIAPVINFSGCSLTSPVTSLTGFSSEADGTTITLYTPNSSGTSLGSTTVSGGNWTKTGLSLNPGTIVVAKVTSGTCLTASADSNPITITAQTNITNYSININTPTEGQTSVSGTISGGTYPVTLKLYVDETQVATGVLIASAGNWSVSGLNSFDLAVGSKVQVSLTGTGCESSFNSNFATVQCQVPADKTISSPNTTLCANSYGSIVVQNSESGVIYTPVLSDGVTVFGYGSLGNGSNITLTTGLLSSNVVIKVKASKLPLSSCSVVLTGNISFTVNPLPNAPTASTPQIYCSSGTTTLSNLSVSVPSGTTLSWYNSLTGGSILASNTNLVNNTTYYAQTQDNTTLCISSVRTPILVQSGVPAVPVANSNQNFCSGAMISDLVATLSGPGTIKWYTANTGGTLKNSSDPLIDGTTYYGETSQNSCVSSSRVAVSTYIYNSTNIVSQSTGTQTQCINGTFSSISVTASGVGLTYQWYSNTLSSNSGGTIITGATSANYTPSALVSGTLYYYCIVNGNCGSPVTSSVSGAFIVNPASVGGTVSGSTSLCSGTNTANLSLSGNLGNVLKWQYANSADFSGVVTDINNTSSSLIVNNLGSSTYYRAVVKNGVCNSVNSSVATLTVNSKPADAVIDILSQPSCALHSGIIAVSSPLGPGLSYSIDGSDFTNTTGNFTGLASGSYSLIVKNVSGCTSNAVNFTIDPVPSLPTVPTVASTTQPTCGVTSGSIVFDSQSGVQYSIGAGYQSGTTFSNLTPGVYALSVRSNADNTCITSALSTVTIQAVPTAPSAPTVSTVTQPTCGAPSGVIVINSQAGVEFSVGSGYQAGTSFSGLAPGYYLPSVRRTTDHTCITDAGSAVTINAIPAAPTAPTGSATQSFCSGNNPKVSDIVISGTSILWYDAASAGNVVATNTPLVNGTSYYASQSASGCESATRKQVTVTILACTGPNIADYSLSLNENTANGTSVYDVNDVHGADVDVDNNALTYSIISGNVSGAFTINSTTGVISVADATKLDYETTPVFTLVVRATNGSLSDDATITISLNNLNDTNPVSVADNYSVNEGATLTVTAPGVLGNDTDADGNSLTAVKVTNPSHGTLTFNANGSFTYVHDGSETTSDVFTYKANDGLHDGNTVNVNITIVPVNDPPVVSDISKSIAEDNTLSFAAVDFTSSYSDADGNSMAKIKITSLPANGTLKLSGIAVAINDEILAANFANLTFEPSADWNGNTSFGWNGYDGTVYAIAPAVVNITVTAVNDPPVVNDFTKTISEDNTLTFAISDFTSAFSDIDGNALSKIKILNLPGNGTLKLSGVNVSINDEITQANLVNLTFVPSSNWNGNTSFNWNGYDGTIYASLPATVHIVVNPVNDPPVVSDITKTISEDNVLTFSATDFNNSFTDIDGNALAKIKITSLPAHGTLKLSGGNVSINDEIPVASLGNLTFDPSSNWNGNTSFGWNGNDGTVYAVSSALVNITVNPVNDPPVVSDLSKTINEDNTLAFAGSDFSSAYTDVDGNLLTKIKITSLPLNGTLKLSGVSVNINDEIAVANLANLTFVPDANWNGTTSFSWNGFDGTVYAVSDANVTITVNAVNDLPVVSDIYKSALMDVVISFASANFTSGYADVENDAMTKIRIASLPSNGLLKLSGVNVNSGDEISVANISNLSFVPNTGYNGTTSFNWNGYDGTGYAVSVASVYLTYSAIPNTPPSVSDISKTIQEDQNLNFTATDFTGAYTDGESNPLGKIKITQIPAHGTLKISGVSVNVNDEILAANLSFLVYEPDPNWNGADEFRWNGFDGTVYAASDAKVSITVSPVNDPPLVSDFSKTTNEDVSISFTSLDFTSSYSDVDGNALSKIKITSLPVHGTLKLSGTNVLINDEITLANLSNLVFIPDLNWNGSTSFDWNGNDGSAYASSGAKVNITVTPVNDPPVVTDIAKSLNEDQTLNFAQVDFTSAYSDVDGNSLVKIKITSLPAHGVLKLSGTNVNTNDEIPASSLGNLSFVPDPDWNGTTSFGWNGFDGTVYAASAANVNLLINPVNDPPVVSDISKTTTEDVVLNFALVDFTSAYSDVDGNALSKIKISSLPAHGTLKLSGTNVLVNDEIPSGSIANLTFVPDPDWNGSTGFNWNGYDGTVYATTDALANLTVTPANDPPVLTDINKTANEDEVVNFAMLDFTSAFSDIDGNVLNRIKVLSLPAHGILKLSGIEVSINDEILAADISNLAFYPDANWNGSTEFDWNGYDGSVYAVTSKKVNLTLNHVNDAPSIGTIYKSTLTNTVVTFIPADFTGVYTDPENDNLAKVKIISLSLHGTLKYSGSNVAVGDDILASNLANLTFEPETNWNGNTSITWNASDGSVYSVANDIISITVSPVPNTPPVVSDISKTINEDQPLVFVPSDFVNAFADGENNLISKVKITSLPANAHLKFNGVDVGVNDEINMVDIGNLQLIPGNNWNGTTSFGWNGFDGTVYALSSANVNIVVSPVNDPPVVSAIAIDAFTDDVFTFSPANFTSSYNDPESDVLVKIKILSLPLHGTLKWDGNPVAINNEIALTDIGKLTFLSDPQYEGTTSFDWNGYDGSSYALTDKPVAISVNEDVDVPVLSDFTRNLTEDTNYSFVVSDFANAFTDDDHSPIAKIRITGLPPHGTLNLLGIELKINDEVLGSQLGNLIFTPDTNWNGTTQFTWNGYDSNTSALTDATVTFVIAAVNDNPIVSDVYKAGTTNNVIHFTSSDFLDAYQDVEKTALARIRIETLPLDGVLKLGGVAVKAGDEIDLADLGTFTFEPDMGWNGNSSFEWNGSDGSLYAIVNAVVHVAVSPVPNAEPVLSDISKTVAQDNILSFNATDFTKGYTDADADPLVKIRIHTLPAHGILKLFGIPVSLNDEILVAELDNLTFVPDPLWSGDTGFEWNAFDGKAYSLVPANVNIHVTANASPSISNFGKSLMEDQPLPFSDTEFKNNYSDPENGPLVKIKITRLPAHGVLKLNGTVVNQGDEIPVADLIHLTYTPDANWNGTDDFDWNGSDGSSYANKDATVSLTISPVNDPPVIAVSPIEVSMNEDEGPLTVAVLPGVTDIDGTDFTVSVPNNPKHGKVVVDANGNLLYTPDPDFNGKDTIIYQVCDKAVPAACTTGKIEITVIPVNDPPALKLPEILETITGESGAKTIDVLSNVINHDGDVVSVHVITNPSHGTVSKDSNGNLVYTPETGYSGKDTLVYEVCDNGTPSLCVTGKIIITITTQSNHAPVADSFEKNGFENRQLPFIRSEFTSHYTDADGDTLKGIKVITLPANGTLMLNGNAITAGQSIQWSDLNSLVFVPDKDFAGQTTFDWQAYDGKDYSQVSGTITLVITQKDVFIPEGFSPNGDGIDDYFIVKGADKYVVTLKVFNRWGNLVFESKHYENNWDGAANSGLLIGTKLPDGTYFYVINFNNGEKETIGYITINR